MGNVSGQDELVTKQELAAFYQALLPYLGGSSSNGGTTYTAGDGISINNDEISIDPMPSEDMDSIFDEFPTGGNIAVTGYVPLGTLISFYGETAPKFFLACDGATYNKADYPELAEHLLSLTNHSQYEVDGDDTKFKVPDLRGEFLRGTGTNSHTNQGDGANVGVHQDGTSHLALVSYEGQVYFSPDIAHDFVNADELQRGGQYQYLANNSTKKGTGAYPANFTSRPTNTSVLYCIAYKDIYSNPMNDYSTDEKVVGTWIDGKTIYQKTLTGIVQNTSSIDLGTTVDEIIDIKGCVKSQNNSVVISLGYYNYVGNSAYFIDAYFYPLEGTLYIVCSSNYIGHNYALTIQYTKTT